MLKSKKWALLAGLMIISMVVAACQPQQVNVPVTVVVKETQQVEVVKTVEVMLPTDTPVPSFSTPHPILGKLENRQGIAYCTNREELIASVYSFIDDKSVLLMDSFIPTSHWAHTAPTTQYPFDAEKGAALFDSMGWKLAEGATYRADDAGNEMNLKFTTTTAQFRQTWAAVFEADMKACGLRILRFHVPASWWFGDTTGLARRDFELGAFAWVGTADPGGQTLYACDQIPSPENGWAGQNYMGWCNEAASKAIKLANNTLDRQERIDQYAIVQEEFAKDMPSLPLFNRAEVLATNPALTGFAPAPGEAYASYNVQDWEIPGKDTIVMGYTQEPASLFGLVEDAFVAANAISLIFGRGYTGLNYDLQANSVYYKSTPTLESGGTVMNTVDVKEGDTVVDSNGDVVQVANGTKLKDADGNEVEFSGTPVKMPQLAITASFVDGLMWSDGTPVTQADVELSDKIVCDKDSGATTFTLCDRTANREYNGTTETYTLVPGFLDPTYFVDYLPGAYPSERVLSDGRKLGDVPASEWATLPEIAESPMGYGPYMITAWEKGQSMSFAANPNFVGGAPKTPNIVITFLADTNAAVAQLLTGDVDVLFGETLGAGAEVQTVVDASKEGKASVYILASATWEHIDISLFVK
jgi:ABC-type transport system substrate-binding protein